MELYNDSVFCHGCGSKSLEFTETNTGTNAAQENKISVLPNEGLLPFEEALTSGCILEIGIKNDFVFEYIKINDILSLEFYRDPTIIYRNVENMNKIISFLANNGFTEIRYNHDFYDRDFKEFSYDKNALSVNLGNNTVFTSNFTLKLFTEVFKVVNKKCSAYAG